jgi:hypothetical protein
LSGASVKEKEVMTLTLGDHRTEHETLGSWREEKKKIIFQTKISTKNIKQT